MDFSKLTLREKVFRTFVLDPRQVTVSGLSLEDFLAKYPVGAMYFTVGKAPDLVVKNEGDGVLDADAIEVARRASKYPLLVCADGMPIDGKKQYMPSLNHLGACGDRKLAFDYGISQGMVMNKNNIDWILGPAVDMNLSRTADTISDCMTDEPDYAADIHGEVVKGIQSQKVAATVKHFPGLCTHHVNMHAGHGQNVLSLGEWYASYGKLYKRLFAEADPACVMTSHVCLESYSKKADYGKIPIATYSKDITIKLLKEELGFKGAVVTDALIMGGMVHGKPIEEAAAAFECGADLLLWPDMDAADAIVAKLESGEIPMSRLDDALERIGRMMKRAGLDEDVGKRPESDMDFVADTAKRTVDGAVELVRNELGILPIKKKGKILIDLISSGKASSIENAEYMASLFRERGFECDVVNKEVQFLKAEADAAVSGYDYIFAVLDIPFAVGACDLGIEAVWTVHFFDRSRLAILNFSSPFFADDYFPDVETFVSSNGHCSMGRMQVEAMVKAVCGEIGFSGKARLKIRKY